MIGCLKGEVIHKTEKSLIVEVSGLGYKVYATFETLETKNIGDKIFLWIHHVTREDSEELFGFDDEGSLKVFELLIGISGIGPKTALNILNVSTPETLRRAVSTSDSSHLIKVSGIGKKNAEKIILELKGKLDTEGEELSLRDEVDALEALKALGYSHKDSREALRNIPKDLGSTEKRIKEALKILSK